MDKKQRLKIFPYAYRLSTLLLVLIWATSSFAGTATTKITKNLLKHPKIINAPSILEDLNKENQRTRVIINLTTPDTLKIYNHLETRKNIFKKKNITKKNDLKQRISHSQDNFIRQLDKNKVRVINKFSFISGISAEITIEGLESLSNHEMVESIEKDAVLNMHTAQGIPLMNATAVRNEYGGEGISIAICDTGIDYTHQQLGNGGFPNSKILGGYDCGDDDNDPMDTQGHGTCCAGIAAGEINPVGDYIGGVAPNAKLYALKISYSTTGSAYTSDMIEGWQWCVDHQYDSPEHPIMIISTSFGGDRYYSACDSSVTAMTQAAMDAVAAGITIFVSSGNDTYADSMGWPACISYVNSIGAVYDANIGSPAFSACSETSTFADKVTCYSNTASFLDFFAPSNNAYTTDISGSTGYSTDNYYSNFGGTSAACPYAAGAAACLQSASISRLGGYLTPDEVRSIFTQSGDLVTDPKAGISKPRINLNAAVAHLNSISINIPEIFSEGDGVMTGTGQITLEGAIPSDDVIINLSSSDSSEAIVPGVAMILSGETTTTFDITIVDDSILDGSKNIKITASSTSYGTIEKVITVHDNESAILSITIPDTATEGDPILYNQGQVQTSRAVEDDVEIFLSSDNANEVIVPMSVTIPSGGNTFDFDLTIFDDINIDDAQTATITASVTGWPQASGTITVYDNEIPSLTIELPETVSEGAGLVNSAGTVSISGYLPADLTVFLSSNDTSEIDVPETVIIPSGHLSAQFDITLLNDTDYDGSQTVIIRADGEGFPPTMKNISITDDDVHHFSLSSITSPQIADVPFNITILAEDINSEKITTYSQTVRLSANGDSGNLPVSPEHTDNFTSGEWSGNIFTSGIDNNIQITVDDDLGHTGTGNLFDTTHGALDHYSWSSILSPQFVEQPFTITINAKDKNGYTVTDFSGNVDITGWMGEISTSTIVITELHDATPDYVEIQNVSSFEVNTSGWIVALNNAELGNINEVHTIYWQLPEKMAAGEILYRTDDSGDNYWGENIWWGAATEKGWAVIIDDNGNIIDFAVWGYSGPEISAMNIVINEHPVIIGFEWLNDGVTYETASNASIQRNGNSDNNDTNDFSWTSLTKGTQNNGLNAPFSGSGSVSQVTISPDSALLTNGSFTGEMKIDTGGPELFLLAKDTSGNEGLSHPFTVKSSLDSDNDGLQDIEEDINQNGIVDTDETDPFNPDSDGDLMADGWEIKNGFDPLSDDALQDNDNDKFSNLREYISLSDPLDDTDIPNCISDFDDDSSIDGTDLAVFTASFGRGNCTPETPCECDLDEDGDVDQTDLVFFTEDFTRTDCTSDTEICEYDQENFETGDFQPITWTNSNERKWEVSGDTPYNGIFAVKTSHMTHNEKAILESKIYCEGDEISFRIKVDSEENYDYLNFYMDETRMDSWSGAIEYKKVVYEIPTPGVHSFKWIYEKDGSISSGQDCAIIDDICFPGIFDSDEDGLPDAWEHENFNNLAHDGDSDTDSDMLTDFEEFEQNTNPNIPDTDMDGMPDGWETSNGLNPLEADAYNDPDLDGYSNLKEYEYITNPQDINDIPDCKKDLENFETGALHLSSFSWKPTGDDLWSVSTGNGYNSLNAAVSPLIGDNEKASLDTTLYCDQGSLNFQYALSSEKNADFLYFYMDDELKGTFSGEINYRNETFEIPFGPHHFKWVYQKNAAGSEGSDMCWLDDIRFPISEIPIVIENFESAGLSHMPWILTGDGFWQVGNELPHNGSFSAVSPEITHSESASMQLDVACQEGDMSFWFSVDSEDSWDFLNFYINDELQGRWSGSRSYSRVSFNVPQGTHTFKWTYEKDGTQTDGADKAWIDDICFPGDEP